MLMSTQVAINGFLGKQLHSSIHVAFISFSIGTFLVLVVVLSEKSYRKLQLSILKQASKICLSCRLFRSKLCLL